MLESRLLYAATPYLGTYRGIATYSLDGITQHVKETITISPVITPLTVPIGPHANEAGIIFARSFGTISTLAASAIVVFGVSLDDAPLPSSRGNHASSTKPLGGTAYIAHFPSKFGLGTIQVFQNELTITGTITTGIFFPASFDFDGTLVTAKSAAVAAPPPAPESKDLFTTLSLNQTLSLNPVLGTFIGHVTRASDHVALKTSAVVAKNKKGHTAITMTIIDPGIGTITIQSVIHPTHTGTFTLPLGAFHTDGTLSGHVTHTGRLILHLTVPGVSDSVGTQVRHH
jgi:hypothetical protein